MREQHLQSHRAVRRVYDDPGKELPDTPVFCLIGGALKKVSSDLEGPNGLAFSPDQKHLYVANWDKRHYTRGPRR